MTDLELTDDERALIEERRRYQTEQGSADAVDREGVAWNPPVTQPVDDEHVAHVSDHPQGGEKLHPDSFGDAVE